MSNKAATTANRTLKVVQSNGESASIQCSDIAIGDGVLTASDKHGIVGVFSNPISAVFDQSDPAEEPKA